MDVDLVNQLGKADLAELGARIRGLRRAKSLTQEDLAAGEVTVGYISRIEAGQRRPDVRLLELFAEQLGTTAEFLVTGEESEAKEDIERLTAAAISWALESGDAAEAHRLVDQLLDSASDAAGRRRAQLLYAKALEAQGHSQDAIQQLEAVAAEAEGADLAEAAIALSRCYRETGELDRAITAGEKALSWWHEHELDATDEAIQLTVTVAAAYFERGDTNYAVRLCRTACDRAEESGSPLAQAAAYWNASIMESRRGATESAVALAESALSLLKARSGERNFARLQLQLGIMLLRLDPPQVDEAAQLLATARQNLVQHGGSEIDIATSAVSLARVHLLRGEPELAAEQALAVHEQLGELAPAVAAEAFVILGETAALAGKRTAARDYYARAVATLTGIGADRAAAQLWFDLAGHLQAMGDVDGALAAYRSASVSAGLVTTGAVRVPD